MTIAVQIGLFGDDSEAPVADLRQAMVLVEFAWNAPVLMQHGTSEVERLESVHDRTSF